MKENWTGFSHSVMSNGTLNAAGVWVLEFNVTWSQLEMCRVRLLWRWPLPKIHRPCPTGLQAQGCFWGLPLNWPSLPCWSQDIFALWSLLDFENCFRNSCMAVAGVAVTCNKHTSPAAPCCERIPSVSYITQYLKVGWAWHTQVDTTGPWSCLRPRPGELLSKAMTQETSDAWNLSAYGS